MLLIFISLLGALLVLYGRDHFKTRKTPSENPQLPLKGILPREWFPTCWREG